jgi:two-component system nitrate/nitrite response regulator NarL
VSTVILVSDQPVLLCGLTHILKKNGFEVAACCAKDEVLQCLTDEKTVDVVLLDITAGLTFGHLTEIHSRFAESPVVLWADVLPLELVFRTFEFGVRGLVQRTAGPEQLCDSLSRVANGEMQIGFGTGRDVPMPVSKPALTPREREIVGKLREGLRNKQIAAEMNITEGTVKIYLFRLFHKLGVRNRFELARSGVSDEMQFGAQAPRFMTGAPAGSTRRPLQS